MISKENILIIGGGRWARVIVEVILDLLPDFSKVFIYSLNNSKSMTDWTFNKKLETRTLVLNDLGKVDLKNIKAVIVVNAAKDHEKSTEWAILNKLPVLVEKPVTLSATATSRLIELADKENTIFASAHVFRFAIYLENFSVILKGKKIKQIQIEWMDSKSEVRHGEKKNYDATLPIYKDVLPHIFSILATLNLPLPTELQTVHWNESKTEIEIYCNSLGLEYKFILTREGLERKRRIRVETNSEVIKLDFSTEPGLIEDGKTKVSADKDWNNKTRPLATMLTTFLNSIAEHNLDSRFALSFALSVNEFADRIENFSR